MPPALFAGVRFLIAGGLLFGAVRLLGRPVRARAREWAYDAVIGLLLLFVGNGLLVWAEQFTPSGVAAVFLVTSPLWLALFDAVIPGGAARPTGSQVVGLLIGFAGTMLLVGVDAGALRTADWRGPLALTCSSIAWALGGIAGARRPRPMSLEASSARQMLAGGMALTMVGTLGGEWGRVQLSAAGAGAMAYLIVFGSLIGYSSYVYLLRHVPPAVVGATGYANTVVAVFLGWLILDEPVTARTVLAMLVVLGSVAWVRGVGRKRPS